MLSIKSGAITARSLLGDSTVHTCLKLHDCSNYLECYSFVAGSAILKIMIMQTHKCSALKQHVLATGASYVRHALAAQVDHQRSRTSVLLSYVHIIYVVTKSKH